MCNTVVVFFLSCFASLRQNCRLNGFYVLSIRLDGGQELRGIEDGKTKDEISENKGNGRPREYVEEYRLLFSAGWLCNQIVTHSNGHICIGIASSYFLFSHRLCNEANIRNEIRAKIKISTAIDPTHKHQSQRNRDNQHKFRFCLLK